MVWTRSFVGALSLGLVAGVCLTGTMLYAQKSPPKPQRKSVAVSSADSAGPFDIVDTPGSTYLLNRRSGEVWRLGFTEVEGDRYWFGTHVPIQPASTFEDFQQRLHRQLNPGKN